MPQQPVHNPLGEPFIELQSVDSTNNYALARIHAGLAQHGMAFFAHEQVAGKGQRGRIWTSQRDMNIALSIVAKPYPLLLSQQFQLSAAVALATHDFLVKYAGDDTRIKWPNDIYWQDRKAGGILIESVIGGTGSANNEQVADSGSAQHAWKWAVIGIGININQTLFPKELRNPVSLKQITGKNFSTVELARELCHRLEHRLDQLMHHGFDRIYTDYLANIYKKDQVIKLRKDNRVFDATLLYINPTGSMVVQHSIEEEFGFGEVEWVL